MKFYNFFRSGTSHRTRIVLNLKGLSYDYVGVDLRKSENEGEAYRTLNPQGLVPCLDDDGFILSQSPAIIEYLEEKYPTPALLPSDMYAKAYVRSLAAIVGCDTHPLNNKRVLMYLKGELKTDESDVEKWCQNWIHKAFSSLEKWLSADQQRSPHFCFGQSPTLADAYLVAQAYSAERFNMNLGDYPQIEKIVTYCNSLEAFQKAHPDHQPDV